MNNVNNNSAIQDMYWKKEETAKAGSADQKLEQEDFFKLLTEQLNMQDPSKPVDNDQMIAQMTSFSMAEGISNLSTQFTQFAESMTSNQALQASTLVGRDVLVPTSKAYVDGSGPANGAIATGQSAQNVKITVKNEVGEVVDSFSLGDVTAGMTEFSWDGLDASGNPVPAGKYQFTASGQIGGANEEMPLQMNARVQSVSMGNGQGIVLNLKGLGGVGLSDVTEIS